MYIVLIRFNGIGWQSQRRSSEGAGGKIRRWHRQTGGRRRHRHGHVPRHQDRHFLHHGRCVQSLRFYVVGLGDNGVLASKIPLSLDVFLNHAVAIEGEEIFASFHGMAPRELDLTLALQLTLAVQVNRAHAQLIVRVLIRVVAARIAAVGVIVITH